MEKANIFDIYRGTTHDGPGIRSTVFFQSCPLSCQWCHNPEGIESGPRIWWDHRSCIGCMLCHKACPSGAIKPSEEGIRIDNELCLHCGACGAACPTNAMSFISREWTLEALMDEVIRDKGYYQKTGGGVTASGGECMNQHDFVSRFFTALQEQGISTALDTSGFAPWSAFEQVLPHTDYVLYDLKFIDNNQHLQFTGQGNALILENVKKIAEAVKSGSCKADLWIRTPMIPGATATFENLSAIGSFLAQNLPDAVSRWELCAFNNSCITKYQRLCQPWAYGDTPLLRAEDAEALRQAAVSSGISPEVVIVTGILAE